MSSTQKLNEQKFSSSNNEINDRILPYVLNLTFQRAFNRPMLGNKRVRATNRTVSFLVERKFSCLYGCKITIRCVNPEFQERNGFIHLIKY